MQVSTPPPYVDNAVKRAVNELRTERASEFSLPPGETRFSVNRTRRFIADPLDLLLDLYQRYGPVFSMRIVHLAANRALPSPSASRSCPSAPCD